MLERFILGGRPELLRALVEVIARDPALKLISVAGPRDAPERLVVEMTAQRADLFRQEHNGQLIIEPDQQFRPFI